jgi:hypothetical protein
MGLLTVIRVAAVVLTHQSNQQPFTCNHGIVYHEIVFHGSVSVCVELGGFDYANVDDSEIFFAI